MVLDAHEAAWMMPIEAFEWIEKNIPSGSEILEFGSGKGSDRLSKNYTLYSVEHNPEWVNKYSSNYIYAPIKMYDEKSLIKGIGWYDVEIIKEKLPSLDFSLIIIDGPPASIGRRGIIENLWILERTNYILMDDLQRADEYELSQEIAEKCNLKCLHFFKSSHKNLERHFAIFMRNEYA